MKSSYTQEYLTGISDYFWGRNKPPKWMRFKLHLNEWKKGWDYAKTQVYIPQ
jgi:hypothetical protein